MIVMKGINTFLIIMTTAYPLLAQQTEPSDPIRSNGLIWVVIGVLVILFIGLFLYLFVIDRKLSKFEKKLNK